MRTPAQSAAVEEAAVEFDGSHYLAAWLDWRPGSGEEVVAARITGTAELLDLRGIWITTRRAVPLLYSYRHAPAVGCVSAQCLVVWLERRTTIDLYAARISASGTLLDPEGVLLKSVPAIDSAITLRTSVAANGNQFLVVWNTPGAVQGTFVPVSNSEPLTAGVTHTERLYSGTSPVATLTAVNARYFVLVADKTLGVFRLEADGTRVDAAPIQIAEEGQQPAIASDGSHVLFSWVSDTPTQIHARVASVALDTLSTPVTIGEGYRPAVTFQSNEFRIIYRVYGGLTYAAISTAGTLTDTPEPLVSTNDVQTYALAAGPSGEFLTLWGLPTYPALRAQRLGKGAEKLGGTIEITPHANHEKQLALMLAGDDLLFAWEVPDDAVVAGRLARNLAQQDPLGIVLSEQGTSGVGREYSGNISAAQLGTTAVVTWNEAGGVRAARVASSGTLLDQAPLEIGPARSLLSAEPHVACLPTSCAIAYDSDSGTRYGRTFAVDGTLGEPTWLPGREAYALTASGDHYVIAYVFVEPTIEFKTSLFVAGIPENLETLTWGPTRVSQLGANALAPAIASNASTSLVVWQRYAAPGMVSDLVAVRIKNDGQPVDSTPIPICVSCNIAAPASVVGTASGFFVAWEERESADIYGTRIAQNGTVESPQGTLISAEPFAERSPVLASVPDSDSVFVGYTRFNASFPFGSLRAFARVICPNEHTELCDQFSGHGGAAGEGGSAGSAGSMGGAPVAGQGGNAGSSGGAALGGQGGIAGEGGSPISGSGGIGAEPAPTGGAGGTLGGNAGATGKPAQSSPDADGDCACHVPGQRQPTKHAWFVLLIAMLLVRKRRLLNQASC